MESIAARHGESLDWTYVFDHLSPLAEAKDEPAILTVLARLAGEIHAKKLQVIYFYNEKYFTVKSYCSILLLMQVENDCL